MTKPLSFKEGGDAIHLSSNLFGLFPIKCKKAFSCLEIRSAARGKVGPARKSLVPSWQACCAVGGETLAGFARRQAKRFLSGPGWDVPIPFSCQQSQQKGTGTAGDGGRLWGRSSTWALGGVMGNTWLNWGWKQPWCFWWGLAGRSSGAAAPEGGFRYVSSDAVALKCAKMVVPVVCLWLRLGLWLSFACDYPGRWWKSSWVSWAVRAWGWAPSSPSQAYPGVWGCSADRTYT